MRFQTPRPWLLWVLALSGCGLWIGPDDLAAVRDRDLDGVPEVDDCDDRDPSAQVVREWFRDLDGDGFGSADATRSCNQPEGFAEQGGDCNDADPTVAPGAPEYCDGVDNDCEGGVDDKEVELTWYDDLDGDGYGPDSSARTVCVPEPVGTDQGGDCDDSDPAVYPDADEICSGIDEDCDGRVDADDDDFLADIEATWFADDDDDGYGTGSGTPGCEPPGPGTWSQVDGDCDDADPDVGPAAPELCDGFDNDCDGDVDVFDDDLADGDVFYPDNDQDGFGDSFAPAVACEQPPNHVVEGGDCDDSEPTIHPREHEPLFPGDEECSDTEDNDCDGVQDAGDEDCQDDDVDGVVNGIDAMTAVDVNGDGLFEGLCFRADILFPEEPWATADVVPVFKRSGLLQGPVNSLSLSDAVALGAHVPGHWCWNLSGVNPDSYEAELVSVIATDGSSSANEGNCTNWKRADLDAYCGSTSDDFCAAGLLVDSCALASRAVGIDWNGSSL